MVGDLFYGLRRAVRFDVSRAGDKLSVDRPDALCEQVGILEDRVQRIAQSKPSAMRSTKRSL